MYLNSMITTITNQKHAIDSQRKKKKMKERKKRGTQAYYENTTGKLH